MEKKKISFFQRNTDLPHGWNIERGIHDGQRMKSETRRMTFERTSSNVGSHAIFGLIDPTLYSLTMKRIISTIAKRARAGQLCLRRSIHKNRLAIP